MHKTWAGAFNDKDKMIYKKLELIAKYNNWNKIQQKQ